MFCNLCTGPLVKEFKKIIDGCHNLNYKLMIFIVKHEFSGQLEIRIFFNGKFFIVVMKETFYSIHGNGFCPNKPIRIFSGFSNLCKLSICKTQVFHDLIKGYGASLRSGFFPPSDIQHFLARRVKSIELWRSSSAA